MFICENSFFSFNQYFIDISFVKNKSKRKKFGRVSKRIVKEKFDLEKSIKKYKKIYDEI